MQMLATNGIGPGKIGIPAQTWAGRLSADGTGGQPGVGLGMDRMRWQSSGPGTQSTPTVAGWMAGQAAAPTALPSTVANLYVRKTGTDNNGGSSASVTPDQTGADGVTNGTTTFTAVSGNFTGADVNKLINIVTKGRYRIVAVGGLTSVTLSGSPTAGSGLTWNLGGAVVTVGALLTIANTPAGSVLGGDRIWIGAGTYRETITITVTPTFELQVTGDVDGLMTGDPGMVLLTAYTTNDKTAPSASRTISMNGKSNLTFQNLYLIGGSTTTPSTVDMHTVTGSTNIIFRDCAIQSGITGGTTVYLDTISPTTNVLFERVIFHTFVPGNNNIKIFNTLSHVDYDSQIRFVNCLSSTLGGTAAIQTQSQGAGAGKPGGVKVSFCTFYSNNFCVSCSDSSSSSSIPMRVANCLLIGGGGITANAFGQAVEDANLFFTSTNRTNVGVGSRSVVANYSPLLSFGQEQVWGGLPRSPYGLPLPASPLLAFATAEVAADLRTGPRPAGGTSALAAVGALERANTVAQAVSPVPPSGTHVWQQTGPGYQDFLVPVTTSATTISVSAQRNSAYTGPMPTLELLQNGQVGVTAQVVPMAGPDSAWETLTLVAFTPSAAGVVTVRIRSQDTLGTALVSFANFTIV